MLEPARVADYAIWGVALLLYVYDAARLLRPREILLAEATGGRLEPVIGDNPFTSATRAVVFGPLHAPHRGVFVAGWGRLWSDADALRATLESLGRFRASLGAARVLGAVAFVLLFLVGPALTMGLGPDAAVVYTAAALYPTVGVSIGVLWCRRRRFQLTPARSALLSVEVLVCPAFLPNLVRKITGHYPIEADGVQVLVALAGAGVRDDFLARLERRAEEMLDGDASDPAAQAQLRTYLTALRVPR